jgi:hypothetical protein
MLRAPLQRAARQHLHDVTRKQRACLERRARVSHQRRRGAICEIPRCGPWKIRGVQKAASMQLHCASSARR